MRFEEKLRKQMMLKGFNQQRLAKASSVSDSEISRILKGKSVNPGLDNALKLARAVGVSLDYLADDDSDNESTPAIETSDASHEGQGSAQTSSEDEILEVAHEIGVRQARRILETVCALGYETAMRRLLEMKPVIELDPHRNLVAGDRRASSA